MTQQTDTFLQDGPCLEIKLLHSLGYHVTEVGGHLYMAGRRITAWVGDVPVCSTLVRMEPPKVRRVEYFCPYTRAWETIVRGRADEMKQDDVIEAIQTKLEETRLRVGAAKNPIPDAARMNAVGFENGIAQLFLLMKDEQVVNLQSGKPALVQYRGAIPFPADVYILPPVKA